MATPEVTPHYVPDPNDPWELQALDAMRGFIANDSDMSGKYAGVIRRYPVSAAIARDVSGNLLPPTLALFSAVEFVLPKLDLGGIGVGSERLTLSMTLAIVFAMEQYQPDSDYLADLHYRAWRIASLCRKVVLRYQSDPGAIGRTYPLWQYLEFPQHTVNGGGIGSVTHGHIKEQQSYQVDVTFSVTSHQILR